MSVWEAAVLLQNTTPLHHAASGNSVAVTLHLLSQGADKHARDQAVS